MLTATGCSGGVEAVPSVCYGCGYVAVLYWANHCVNTVVSYVTGACCASVTNMAGGTMLVTVFGVSASFD